MRKTFRFFILILLCVVLFSSSCSKKKKEDTLLGKLEISPTETSVGLVEQGEKVKAEFTLKNTGQSGVFVKALQTSCPCMYAEAEANYLSAGQETKVHVSFDTAGRIGEKRYRVAIISDLVENPVFSLLINVMPWLAVEPNYHFIPFDAGKEKLKLQSIAKNMGDKPITIKSLKVSKKGITIVSPAQKVFPKVLPPGEEMEIQFVLDMSLLPAPLKTAAVIETVEDRKKQHEILFVQSEKPFNPK